MTSLPDDPTSLRLDDRLCLALYTASRAMTARYRPLLDDLGLTYPQYLVLVLLWEEGPRSVGQVGSRLSLESSTLSPLLKRLEAIGLLTRRRDPRDERAVTVGSRRRAGAGGPRAARRGRDAATPPACRWPSRRRWSAQLRDPTHAPRR